MHAHRLRSCELPVTMRARTSGRSTITAGRPAYYMLKVLLAIFVGLFRRRPVADIRIEPVTVPEADAVIAATQHLSTAANQRVEVIILAVVVSGLIFELVRRKRLDERYALLWLGAGAVVLVLALWKGLLTHLSHAVGIYYPPSALFAVAFLFVLVMLVHFSTAVSKLADQNKILAQRVALLQQRLDDDREPPLGSDRDASAKSSGA